MKGESLGTDALKCLANSTNDVPHKADFRSIVIRPSLHVSIHVLPLRWTTRYHKHTKYSCIFSYFIFMSSYRRLETEILRTNTKYSLQWGTVNFWAKVILIRYILKLGGTFKDIREIRSLHIVTTLCIFRPRCLFVFYSWLNPLQQNQPAAWHSELIWTTITVSKAHDVIYTQAGKKRIFSWAPLTFF